MTDLSDVTSLLAQSASAAVYPNGVSSPNVASPAKIFVYEGWPTQPDLDAAMRAGDVHVSVFPMQGSTSSGIPQFLDRQQIVTPAVHGLVATISNDAGSVTVTGTPSTGEFLTITLDNAVTYSRGDVTVAAILTAIAADAAATYVGTSVAGGTITFPGAHTLEARSGAPAVAGIVTYRQKALVMVTVWAPTPALRNLVASTIDGALKANLRVTMPDSSQAIVRPVRTNTEDNRINDGIFRRDMVFDVEYATLDTYPVVEITSFGAALDLGLSSGGHVANAAVSFEGTYP